MQEKIAKSTEMFNSGFNCAQSVLAAFCDKYKLNTDPALKLACGFGGGIRSGEVCGAASGALMVIGLKYGQLEAGDEATKKYCHARVRDFMDRFRADNGSILCRDLLGCDVATEEGRAHADRHGLIKKTCPQLVENAVQILDDFGY